MQARTRAELLALTPDRYLRDGYLDADGAVRVALLGDYASAAAAQLIAAEASPQALSLEGIRQVLPLQHGGPAVRLGMALDESLQVVAGAIRQANNAGLVRWIRSCAAGVRTEPDVAAFLNHVQASLRQHALLVAMMASQPLPGNTNGPLL